MLDQDENFMISLSILITCLLDNLWILKGEVACQSLLGVKGLRDNPTVVICQTFFPVIYHCTDPQQYGIFLF